MFYSWSIFIWTVNRKTGSRQDRNSSPRGIFLNLGWSEQHLIENSKHIFHPRNELHGLVPNCKFMYQWAIYVLPWLVLGRSIVGIYKSLTDTWMWKLGDRTLQFYFENNDAEQFHFWEYIIRNQTFILDSHRPFICSEETEPEPCKDRNVHDVAYFWTLSICIWTGNGTLYQPI
jgi:hypothetical protein